MARRSPATAHLFARCFQTSRCCCELGCANCSAPLGCTVSLMHEWPSERSRYRSLFCSHPRVPALHACLPLLTTGALVSRSTLCTSGAAYVLVAAEAPRWCGGVAPPPAGEAPPPLLLSQPPLFARTTTTLRARGGQAGAGRQDAAAQVRMVTSARQRPQWHLVRAQGVKHKHTSTARGGPPASGRPIANSDPDSEQESAPNACVR